MKFHFKDGKTVKLTMDQMHEVYREYMRQDVLNIISPERGDDLYAFSDYPEEYTKKDIKAVTEEIIDWMEDNTLGGEGVYNFIGDSISEYDKKFEKTEE